MKFDFMTHFFIIAFFISLWCAVCGSFSQAFLATAWAAWFFASFIVASADGRPSVIERSIGSVLLYAITLYVFHISYNIWDIPVVLIFSAAGSSLGVIIRWPRKCKLEVLACPHCGKTYESNPVICIGCGKKIRNY